MIELTIGDLLDGKWNSDADVGRDLYVVKDTDGLTLYVGKSTQSVILRMYTHLGKGQELGGFPGSPDRLGRLILRFLPESRSWVVQMYRRKEILTACIEKGMSKAEWEAEPIRRLFPRSEANGQDRVVYPDLNDVEEILIRELRPCLNITHNANGRELPQKYREDTGTGAIRAVEAVFRRNEQ